MAHTCHAFGCSRHVKPEMFMCAPHWRKVPRQLQARIWATYRPGQCDDKNISTAYAETAKASIIAVAAAEGKAVPDQDPCLVVYDICLGDSASPSLCARLVSP